ncbi:hypothetical protein AQF52_1489 [Streptomyces venezuelae]|uniref:hypothetical protein n=1 Tax=Streptomyces gardneri TaxID=66892 RepID=UPI000716B858|nr:hypothetical protein [Streptomyces gardneri]ALO07085.1 hypothetical protein AQF52_1489 [Streptomyces venezuelae]QPK44445.1 hypothetical protein H4W23_07360 [Streptomyces gardneri]WRK35742.1 hypothetical protein U0M97_07395 [Streptomyces venezuelae]
MGEELVLASKWDVGVDVVRFLWVGFFSSLPAWARYTVLALFGATLVYGFVSWLRNRSASVPEAEEAADEAQETAPEADLEAQETVQDGETRVR